MAEFKIYDRRHPLYEQFVDDWMFYLQSFNGGDEYIATHLETHRLENPSDYNRRKNRAYYLNYCSPIATIPSDFIFKKEATRPADIRLSAFRENVDRRGTNIHEFMRKICILGAVYGTIHILIDKPQLPDTLKTDRVTKYHNTLLRPYVTVIPPQNLLDWSVNVKTQELNWILLYETIYDDEDFTQERGIKEQFKIWTTQDWIIYDEDGNEVSRGHHGLGKVPLLTHYHKDIDLNLVGESMIKDVAEANKAVFNWCSTLDEMICRQTFSQLICPDDGSMGADEVDGEGGSKALKAIGTASAFTYPMEARHPPSFISPDTKQLKVIWDMIVNHSQEMFRLSGLISAKTSMINAQKTGKAQEMEFLDMAVFLATKSKSLEGTENKINELFYLWQGESAAPERVHYPDKFDIVSPLDIIDLYVKVTTNAISGRLNKEMAKRLVHQVLPHAEDEIVDEINKEIEANKFLEDPTLLYNNGETNTVSDEMTGTEGEEIKKNQREKDKIEDKKQNPKRKTEPIPNYKNPSRQAKFRKNKTKV
jgi:hypothetical protein